MKSEPFELWTAGTEYEYPLFCNQVELHPPAPYWADDFLVHWPRNSVRVSTVQRKQWRKRRCPWNHIAYTVPLKQWKSMVSWWNYSSIILLRLPLAVFEVICAVAVYMQFDGVSAEQKPVSPRTKTQEPREARESKFLICEERPNSVCV